MAKIKLKEIAEKLGKTATDIAKETGINRNTINALMKGLVEDVKFSTLEKICKTYGLQIHDILDTTTSSQPSKASESTSKLYLQEGSLVPFTCWSWVVAVNAQAKEFFNFGFGPFKLVFEGPYGWVYWDHDSLYKLSRYIYDKYGYDNKILDIYNVFTTHTKALEDIYLEASFESISKLSDNALIDYFNVLWNSYQKFWKYSVFIDSFDPGLDQEEINNIANKHNFSKEEIGILTTPSRMTFNNERLLALLNIIGALFNKKITQEKLNDFVENDPAIKQYTKCFDYYKSNYSFIRQITEEEIIEEINKYLQDRELFKKEFGNLKNYTSIQEDAIKKVLKNHQLSSNPLSFFNLLTFWREERKKFNLMGIYVFDLILRAIEERTGIPKSYLQYLSYEEVENVIKGLITKSTLERRHKDGIVVELDGAGGYKIIEGKEAVSIRDELQKQLLGDQKQTVLPGQVASQGYAKGIARIILDEKDFDKFNEGEILVTGMTRPEFVPLMKKAAGIVTNEGGITCHAAIVSRELGKPCVIGTKVATKVIKDGDLVEVRANHGTVRIIQ